MVHPQYFFIMPNPLVVPAGIGAASSVGTGLIGAISGSPHRQYKYQKRLMDRQNAYNVQNATIAYNRSRELTQDSAMLEKLGKFQAGINTAFGQDGNVANASSAPQSSGVSIPSAPDLVGPTNALSSGINNAVQTLIGVESAKANIRKLTAEAEGNEIDNLTRNIRNLKEVGLKQSQISKNFAELAYQKVVNKYAENRLSAEADSANSKALIDQADSSVRAAMNKADYDMKVQEINNKVQTGLLTHREAMTELKKLSVMDSEINRNNAAASLDRASVPAVREQSRLYRSQWENQDIENYIKNESGPALIKAAKLSADEHGPQSISEWTWKVLNNWDKEPITNRVIAVLGIPFSFVERTVGGAAVGYAAGKGNQMSKAKPVKVQGFNNTPPKPKGFVRKVIRGFK